MRKLPHAYSKAILVTLAPDRASSPWSRSSVYFTTAVKLAHEASKAGHTVNLLLCEGDNYAEANFRELLTIYMSD